MAGEEEEEEEERWRARLGEELRFLWLEIGDWGLEWLSDDKKGEKVSCANAEHDQRGRGEGEGEMNIEVVWGTKVAAIRYWELEELYDDKKGGVPCVT